MASTLIIPGVQVRTQFEPAPVLPGATGVLGVVGVADRGSVDPTPLGSVAELIDQFGPASRYTMPEIRTAFANGVRGRGWRAIAPGPGPEGVAHRHRRRRRAAWSRSWRAPRAPGATSSRCGSTPVTTLDRDRREVRRPRGALARRGRRPPRQPGDGPGQPERPLRPGERGVAPRRRGRPGVRHAAARARSHAPRSPSSDARAASAVLKAGAVDAVRVEAKRAGAGRQPTVRPGRRRPRTGAPSRARATRRASTSRARAGRAGRRRDPRHGAGQRARRGDAHRHPAGRRRLAPTDRCDSIDELVTRLADDPDVRGVDARRARCPRRRPAQPLPRAVDVTVFTEGRDPRVYAGIGTVDASRRSADPAVRSPRSAPTAAARRRRGHRPHRRPQQRSGAGTGRRSRRDAAARARARARAAGALEVEITQGTSTHRRRDRRWST